MSDNFYKVSKGLSLNGQASTPSNPVNGDIYYDSTLGKLRKYENGSWSNFGSGGGGVGLNMLGLSTDWLSTSSDDQNAEATVGVWTAYADAAAASPVDMTGGSPNTTITRTTTSGEILNGAGSFRLNKSSGASRQGEGISALFNVPPAYQGKPVTVSFPWRITSGSLVQGDFKVFIYDVTNSILLTPSSNDFVGTLGTMTCSFTTSLSAGTPANQQYRIGIHVASTTNSSINIAFDDVLISPGMLIQTQIVTPWQNAGPTVITGTTSNPTKGTTTVDKFWWRRVGQNMECRIEYVQTVAGSNGSGDYLFAIPSGYVIDTTVVTPYTTILGLGGSPDPTNIVGSFVARTGTSSAANMEGGVSVFNTTTVRMIGIISGASATNSSQGAVSSGIGQLGVTAIVYGATFSVPIQGWGTQSAITPDQTDFGWSSYVPAITSTGSSPTKGTVSVDIAYYRRLGDSLELVYTYYQTVSGSSGTGIYLIGLPLNLSIDTTKITASTDVTTAKAPRAAIVGSGSGYSLADSTVNSNAVFVYDATHLKVALNSGTEQYWGNNTGVSSYGLGSGNEIAITFRAVIPIAGWTMNQRAPTLLGSVTSNSQNAERIERASIANNGTASITRQSGSWLTGVVRNGTGDMTFTIASGSFSAVPTVLVTAVPNSAMGAQVEVADYLTTRTTTTFRVLTLNGSTVATDMGIELLVMGPR